MLRAFHLLGFLLSFCLGCGLAAQTSAPIIFVIDAPSTVDLGERVTMSVAAVVGNTSLTFQWKKAGVDIAGATGATYIIPAAAPGDAGTYSVTATNAAGTATQSATLTVLPGRAPVIGTPSTLSEVLEVGQPLNIGFIITGSFPRTYQWRRDGNAIAGATQDMLTVPNVTTADAGVYTLLVTNQFGSATSRGFSLTVTAATPLVLNPSYPQNTTVLQGERLTLEARVSTGANPFAFQWLKNGEPIAGATSYLLTIAAASVSDAGRYSATVRNGSASATTREATVTVTPATAPVIRSTSSSTVSVIEGESATLTFVVSGTFPMTYQWRKDGTPLAGATQSVYSLQRARPQDAGVYSLVATNIAGSTTSSTTTVTVAPPTISGFSTQPADREVAEGSSVFVLVSAGGRPTPDYQWYFNGVRMANESGTSISFTATSATAGDYYVVATNAAGSVTSRTFRITVLPALLPAVRRLGTAVMAPGGSASFYASDLSAVPARYQWYHNGTAIAGATSSSYSVTGSTAAAGEYFVVTSNSSGSSTSFTGNVIVQHSAATPPAGAWVAAERSGNMVYFAFASPARIERFDLTTSTWLTPLPLPRAPAAMAVDANGIYVGAGTTIYRYTLNGAGETVFGRPFTGQVKTLTLARGYLLAYLQEMYSTRLVSLRASDGTQIASQNYTYYWNSALAAAPSRNRLFSVSSGISPSDIVYTTFGPDGVLGQGTGGSPYHGAYSTGYRVFVSPNDAYVADDSGTVYDTSNLRFAASLGGKLVDLDFTADGRPIVLRSGQLLAYTAQFQEAGRIATGLSAGARVFLEGGTAHVFGYPPAGGQIQRAQVALSSLSPPPVAAASDATTLSFTPDSAILDRDGTLLLFSRLHRQIFRWSTRERAYLAPIQLQGSPNHVAYSATKHRIYLGYADNRILQVKLDTGGVLEEPFAIAPSSLAHLAMAGEYVFVVDEGESRRSYVTYDGDGKLMAARDSGYIAAQYEWNPATRCMYQFRDGSSPDDLLYIGVKPDGSFSDVVDSPFHGEIEIRYPIRFTPDGSSVLLGSGKFFDATTLTINASLGNRIDDAAWVSNRLVTGRVTVGGAELQRWGGGNYALDRTKVLPGRLVRLHAIPDNRLLVVTMVEGNPSYTILDVDLTVLSSDSSGPPTRIANLAARAQVGRGDQVLIPGFVVSGSQAKRVLIRASGPALAAFGVSGALGDPQFTVVNNAGVTVASNDNWGTVANLTELTEVTGRVGAFALSVGSKDAAAVVSLPPGAYSVQTRGTNDTTGVALVEIYDAQDVGSSSKLINIAARAQVGTGADMLIPGIVIQGSTAKTMLIRAVGPGLAQFGVTGVLGNPRLRLYQGDRLILENDDWGTSSGSSTAAQVAAAGKKTGAFDLPTNSKDAALLVTLEPGAYTAQVSGADGGTGVALVEVYEVSN